MSNTTETLLDIITSSYRICTVIDEITPPSAEQGQTGLVLLNNMMTNLQADLGVSMGWYPQTDITRTAPLQDQDIRGIKYLLAVEICLNYGMTIEPELSSAADVSGRQLTKRYINYVDSDLTGLPFSQGGIFGPGRV